MLAFPLHQCVLNPPGILELGTSLAAMLFSTANNTPRAISYPCQCKRHSLAPPPADHHKEKKRHAQPPCTPCLSLDTTHTSPPCHLQASNTVSTPNATSMHHFQINVVCTKNETRQTLPEKTYQGTRRHLPQSSGTPAYIHAIQRKHPTAVHHTVHMRKGKRVPPTKVIRDHFKV